MACPFGADNTAGTAAPSGATSPSASANRETSSFLGFEAPDNAKLLKGDTAVEGRPVTHYGTYLSIDTLLNIQSGPAHAKPGGQGMMHHEENTFVIVHQVFELWFKLVLADLRRARELLMSVFNRGNAAQDFYQVSHLLSRIETTIVHATNGFSIMETMHPSDFLEFRDFLVPASGFQSASFRVLEGILGVADVARATVNDKPVKEYLTDAERTQVQTECQVPSVSDVLTTLLTRIAVPSDFIAKFTDAAHQLFKDQQYHFARVPVGDAKAERLIASNMESLESALADPAAWCEGLFLDPRNENANSDFRKAFIAALFITSYRHEPRFAVVAQLLDQLIAVEEATLLWRGRHTHMAERMLGRRAGTGGTSSGVGYLDVTRRYRVFHVLWLVRRVAVRSSALPPFSSYTDIPEVFTSS